MFTHVIMTRFNLATPGREAAIRNQSNWLQNRFDLFERFCLPSVAGQSDQNFNWIIYFDEDTPREFGKRIIELQSLYPFHAYFTGLFKSEGWPRSVEEVLSPKTPHLLTTRLDNDDALSIDFVARLQDCVSAKYCSAGFYNIRKGLVRRGGALYEIDHSSNAFASLCEPLDRPFRTISSIPHMEISAYGPVHQVPGPPGWMQVVHGENVSNKVRGKRVQPAVGETLFDGAAAIGYDRVIPCKIFFENNTFGHLRKARDNLFNFIRRHVTK